LLNQRPIASDVTINRAANQCNSIRRLIDAATKSRDNPSPAEKLEIMLTIPNLDCEFEEPPLMLALAQIKFTQSPEIFEKITVIKAVLGDLGMPVAQSKQQVNVAVVAGAPSPSRISQSLIWWFHSLDRRRAMVVAQNSLVFYDASYSRFAEFSALMHSAVEVIISVAGGGCFLTTVAMRYLSGFASDGSPSPYLAAGLHGLDQGPLNTSHFHHRYNFWCTTENEGRLVLNASTVHGGQLFPPDLAVAEIAIDPRFRLPNTCDAVQLDIHETTQLKKLEPFDADRVDQSLAAMRRNIKGAFLLATTPRAHEKWKLKTS
jgi:uncharacterized protein (TIGR04255 family)